MAGAEGVEEDREKRQESHGGPGWLKASLCVVLGAWCLSCRQLGTSRGCEEGA